ncbi:polyhydroxyalkanoate biosynthesis repressor PhaR [Hahella sp. CCB-MM4]|uniref:N-acetylneuraminate synthase family protein n=1 Tax=Hahella sp. (strain CCB-MM4) TaxID=1926491 RepID=UPI000B9AC788|nr:N-acetylneuraminate synthase family protein [Hahella sp. CCB-MM4]OZG74920.1 polyhydroxyalkanoate biosynthesis repressor PhaR [Hahella sp. CCB-MM4]
MAEFKIGNRLIGDGAPPLVIAEIGINHGGKLSVAIEMAKAAKRAGAEIVKHQTHIVSDEMSQAAKQVIPGNADISIYEIMESCALSKDEEVCLKSVVEELGMIYISTPFSRAAADFLNSIDVPAFKIGSGECNNLPLIEHIAAFGKPIILSTGMNDIQSVARAVEVLRSYQAPYALMHCTNVYPTPHHLVRLGAMVELKEAFPDAVVGLSDHTTSNNACLGAVALGAALLERHFTDHMERAGPDIVCSMDEAACRELIRGAHEIFLCRGGKKVAIKEEQVTMDFAFSTVVAIENIEKGELLSKDNIWVKRPGTGQIKAESFNTLLGKRAKSSISKDQHLSWDDIE